MKKSEEIEKQITELKAKIRELNQSIYRLEEEKKQAELDEQYPKGTVVRSFSGDYYQVLESFPGYLHAKKISITGNISRDIYTLWASNISGIAEFPIKEN